MKLFSRAKGWLTAVTFLALILIPPAASAMPITYTFTGIGSGYWNSINFSEIPFTVTLPGDTDDVTGADPLENNNLTATIEIPGVGTGTFQDLFDVKVYQGEEAVSFERDTKNYLYLRNADLAAYDLQSSFGPISGEIIEARLDDILTTSGGNLTLDGIHDTTFAAETVPAPAGLLLLGSGLLSLLGYGRRQGRERG